MRIFKIIVWVIFFIIAFVSVGDAAIEGGSHLTSWASALLVSSFIFYWILHFLTKFIDKETPITSMKEKINNVEPFFKNIFRISVLLLMMLGVDKIDKFTWDIARNQVTELIKVNEKLTDIYAITSDNQQQ